MEHLKFLSAIGMRHGERNTRSEIMAVLETVGLAERAGDRAGTYSFGMKQRLSLAQTLLPMPLLLVFDEPTDGLDPIAVVELRGLLKRLQIEHNLTMILSSQLLGEVEKLVCWMANGRQWFQMEGAVRWQFWDSAVAYTLRPARTNRTTDWWHPNPIVVWTISLRTLNA